MSERFRDFSLSRFRAALTYFLAGRIAQALAMIGFTFVAVRLLSTKDFAAYMLVFGLIEAGRPLVSLGIVPMLQQFLPEQALHGTVKSIVRLTRVTMVVRLALTAFLAAASYSGWPILLNWLAVDARDVAPALLVSAVVVASLMADYSVTVLETLMRHRLSQPLRASLPVGKLIALLTLFYVGHLSLEALLYTECVLAALCALLGEVLLARTIASLRPDGTRRVDVSGLLAFAWHMSGAQLLAVAGNPGMVRLAAARVLGIEELALFSFLQQLATHLTRFMPSTQFASLLRPMLVARQVTGQTTTVAAAINLLWKLNMLVGMGVLSTAWAGGDGLARWLYGRPGDSAGAALFLMLMIPALTAQEHLSSIVLQLRRRTRAVRLLGALALPVPAAVVAGGAFGIRFAALFLVVSIAVLSIATLIVSCKSYPGVRPHMAGFARATLAALVATGIGASAGLLADPQEGVAVLIAPIVALLAYPVLLRLVQPISRSDYELVLRLWPRAAYILRNWVGKN